MKPANLIVPPSFLVFLGFGIVPAAVGEEAPEPGEQSRRLSQ